MVAVNAHGLRTPVVVLDQSVHRPAQVGIERGLFARRALWVPWPPRPSGVNLRKNAGGKSPSGMRNEHTIMHIGLKYAALRSFERDFTWKQARLATLAQHRLDLG